MKSAPPSRRDRLGQILADLRMPGALEVLDAILFPGDKLLILVCGAPGVGKTVLSHALRKRLLAHALKDPNWDPGRRRRGRSRPD